MGKRIGEKDADGETLMSLLKNFSKVRGELQENANLSEVSWFGTGGNADLLFIPADMDDLATFLKLLPKGTPITVLGAMSNILVRSGGIRGVTIRLGKWFKQIFLQNNVIEIGTASNCSELSIFAMDHELGGLEFLAGIPGSLGGAIRMNAGCYGSEVFDMLLEFEAIDFQGNLKWCKAEDILFEYRKTNIPQDWIITRAWFKGNPDVDYSISKLMREYVQKKQETQPLDKHSCGSTFKNPKDKKAWSLIEQAGCKGLRHGGAMVSTKHANFIVNNGNATPDDIENLGEEVIRKVKENSGITLKWEIIRVGERKTNQA